MPVSELTVDQTRAMLIHVANKIEENKDLLSAADRAIGDGDHGIGMARGFAAVRDKLQTGAFASVGDVFKATGMALMMSIGGAAGAVFGTLFMGGARNLMQRQCFGSHELSQMLADGLQAVQERGKAKPGDKTMVDALQPAAEAARQAVTAPLASVLPLVAEAARQGMENTKQMVAAVGKAKTLGERSLGHPDPGAVSTYLILDAMCEYVAGVAPV